MILRKSIDFLMFEFLLEQNKCCFSARAIRGVALSARQKIEIVLQYFADPDEFKIMK